ncbi:hypothetical protein RHMOL_Rhmol09G0197700 [Rhododendron molle]|uniref:Uncharacterized protein n=2 Tax=Rhododendron molle TaxID=49168 RepID=A0ACC0MH27_RHOML|nr:hypothetical protein RHMOL_Rhmol09G0197700 [Rhododendron molle]KAI8539625.1 hypothetical protein RHMOL_Rhmol09G0197700 [Rhododendron molle]
MAIDGRVSCCGITVILVLNFSRYLGSVLPNKSVGSHGLLQQGNSKYDIKRRELAEYYHPLEFNPTIPLDEKAKLMEEWWEKTHALLIEGGLTYDAIKNSVANATIEFREGVVELFEFLEICHWWEIDLSPLVSFSRGTIKTLPCKAAFPGFSKFDYEVLILCFRCIIKNLVLVSGKTIHVLNNNEHALDMAAPVHDQLGDTNGPVEDIASVKKRTSVLLLGDHIGDLGMNHNAADSLESYRKAFDVVYLVT